MLKKSQKYHIAGNVFFARERILRGRTSRIEGVVFIPVTVRVPPWAQKPGVPKTRKRESERGERER